MSKHFGPPAVSPPATSWTEYAAANPRCLTPAQAATVRNTPHDSDTTAHRARGDE
jgi:hypothetical protein